MFCVRVVRRWFLTIVFNVILYFCVRFVPCLPNRYLRVRVRWNYLLPAPIVSSIESAMKIAIIFIAPAREEEEEEGHCGPCPCCGLSGAIGNCALDDSSKWGELALLSYGQPGNTQHAR